MLVGFSPMAFATPSQHDQVTKARPGGPSSRVKQYRLDTELTRRMNDTNPRAITRVILTLNPGATLPSNFKQYSRKLNLDLINSVVLDLPNTMLKTVASHPDVFQLHYDRPIRAHNFRTAVTVGAQVVRETLGYSGAGIGVAIIDSGISTWHDDLTNKTSKLYPYGNQRVAKFVDFVNGRSQPYDDNGHGTHVAGTIAGNGYDSFGEKSGIAPDASLVSLKVLDAHGQGTISNIIAALNWVATSGKSYNVKVVNMSVGAGVYESYWTDPLTLAAKAVAEKGVVVVSAAGNRGKNDHGDLQWGGITAPGNAPWVLTVGASSTMGTLTRNDDEMAAFSSSGPTYIDYAAKPDLVAPGVGTISLAVPGSTFYANKAQYLVTGRLLTSTMPYLALSGTSMAAPVVSGTVALMLQANPTLTPNLVKAILQYTAQRYSGYSALRQGAGFLNTYGAVKLARFYATATAGSRMPVQGVWSREIIWGNHRIRGGYLTPTANAWKLDTVWGSAKTTNTLENIVWGTNCGSGDCGNVVWGTSFLDNVVWGTSGDLDNVVWGTSYDLNVVWGTNCGGADCDNVVWGTFDALDNIVWGTCDRLDNVVWGTSFLDNIVWGTSSDADVAWGSDAGDDTVVYSDDATEPLPSIGLEFGDIDVPVPAPVVDGLVSNGGL